MQGIYVENVAWISIHRNIRRKHDGNEVSTREKIERSLDIGKVMQF